MAQQHAFVCNQCSKRIESWDDGNPYYFDAQGKKSYAYHPDPKRDGCVGNDWPFLCLSCGKSLKVDSGRPRSTCPSCKSSSIRDTCELDGENCPYCQKGVFRRDEKHFAIS